MSNPHEERSAGRGIAQAAAGSRTCPRPTRQADRANRWPASRLLLPVVAALLAPAGVLGFAPSPAGAALSSGRIQPASGYSTTRFTYNVNYTNAADIAPDQVSVGIWWGSRGATYWYKMAQMAPATVRKDFHNVVVPAGPTSHKALRGHGLGPSKNGAEASQTDVHDIETSDDRSWDLGDSLSDRDYQTYRFHIGEPGVSQLDILWEGHGGPDLKNGVDLYIWNNNTSAWEKIGHSARTSAPDDTLSWTINSNAGGYIDTEDYLWLCAISDTESEDRREDLVSCDYVRVDVTYGGGDNYAAGVWYTCSIIGLDSSAHAYRFVAQAGQTLFNFPEPAPNYLPGPTVAGVPVRMGLVAATSEIGPQALVGLQADKTRADAGDYVTFTATVSLPADQSEDACGVTVAYWPDPVFTAVDGTCPVLVENSARVEWPDGSAQTRRLGSRIVGQAASVLPAGGIFIVRCGDFAPGDTAVYTFRCRVSSSANSPTCSAGPDRTIAPGGSTTLLGSAGGGTPPYDYSWSPSVGLSDPYAAQPAASPSTTTTYTLTVTDSTGQTATAQVTVTIGSDDAVIVSTNLPTYIVRGTWQTVRITVRNTGMTTWTAADGYALSPMNPADNTVWGLSRIALSPSDYIAPGQDKTFVFTITAPDTASDGIPCDWQMVHQGIGGFGMVSSSSIGVHTFADVPPSAPYWRHVEAIYRLQVTFGCGRDYEGRLLFCPNGTLTRKEAAVFLVRTAGMTPLMPSTPTFADVTPDQPYYGYVERLADPQSWCDAGNPCLVPPTQGCGYNPPYTGNVYCPNTVVTRAQIAVFLDRAKGKCVLNSPTPTFADVPVSAYYYGYVERLADTASWAAPTEPPTQGCNTNPLRFCPNDNATRAQMAVFLARAWAP